MFAFCKQFLFLLEHWLNRCCAKGQSLYAHCFVLNRFTVWGMRRNYSQHQSWGGQSGPLSDGSDASSGLQTNMIRALPGKKSSDRINSIKQLHEGEQKTFTNSQLRLTEEELRSRHGAWRMHFLSQPALKGRVGTIIDGAVIQSLTSSSPSCGGHNCIQGRENSSVHSTGVLRCPS